MCDLYRGLFVEERQSLTTLTLYDPSLFFLISLPLNRTLCVLCICSILSTILVTALSLLVGGVYVTGAAKVMPSINASDTKDERILNVFFRKRCDDSGN